MEDRWAGGWGAVVLERLASRDQRDDTTEQVNKGFKLIPGVNVSRFKVDWKATIQKEPPSTEGMRIKEGVLGAPG